MSTYLTPGVYKEDVFQMPREALRTGVPAFLGYVEPSKAEGNVNKPQRLTLWPEFEENYGSALPDGYLALAVRGFFENGGHECIVVPLNEAQPPEAALEAGLEALKLVDDIDLVCAPDIMRPSGGGDLSNEIVQRLQKSVLAHCDKEGDRFAILDSFPSAGTGEVLAQKRALVQGLSETNGALYYPWVLVQDGPQMTQGFMPPCGHVAGVYARTDARVGVYKAPANEVLEGVLDLEVTLDNTQQDQLNPEGVNCLRSFPGRGIRVWGARTLSGYPWTYVSLRRLFLSTVRWIEHNLTDAVFEPVDTRLWARIKRELTAYFNGLFQRGALRGGSAQDAFFIKCDEENNPQEVRDAGMVITDIGMAATVPGEFIVIRIIHGPSGVTITTPSASTPPPISPAPTVPTTPPIAPEVRTAPPQRDLRITYIEYNPAGPDPAGEYVVIQNQGTTAVNMTGWRLNDKAFHTYEFPPFTLNPGAFVRVWTRSGIDTAVDLFWGRGTSIWNNVGDEATLRYPDGREADRYSYSA